MKIFKWILIGVVAVVVIGIVITYMSLNRIVRSTVQTQATDQLGVQTTLGGANVSIFGGSLGLNDLQIASPQGFTAPKMFTLGGTDVSVSLGQLRSDPVHVKEVNINKPTLVIEQVSGKFNFKALMDQMPKPADAPDKKDAGKDQMKLIIDKLKVNDASVLVKPGIPGLPPEINVPLPQIDLDNVGTGEGNQNGAALKEVEMQVVTTMAAKATESDKLPPELKQLMNLDVNQVTQQLSAQFKDQLTAKVGDLTKNLPGNVGAAATQMIADPKNLEKEAPKAAEDALKGLLSGADKKKKQPATTPGK